MDKDFGSWFPNQQSDLQTPYINSVSTPIELGHHNSFPDYMRPSLDTVPINGNFPVCGFSGSLEARANQPSHIFNGFNWLPHFCQASGLKEKLTATRNGNCDEVKAPNGVPGSAQRRFLVFDQSGDQPTLIFSSRIGDPAQRLTSWMPQFSGAFDLNKDASGSKRDAIYPFLHHLTDGHNEEDDIASEMHEDTEELNALLYSDFENDYSDDDEASTGHSPSTMTSNDKQEWSGESGEEVASSAAPEKRLKLSNGAYDVPLFEHAAKTTKLNFFEDGDAESSCGSCNYDPVKEQERGSLSGKKRARKEKIRETVHILQRIIPSGKGKDAIGVLDEAIDYLKSMKPVVEAQGLDAI